MRGYHVYQKLWTPDIGEILPTERERFNKHDSAAVAVIKSGKIVGHVPKEISKFCSTFIKMKGNIKCEVTSEPRDQELTMTRDKLRLEVPCIYTFSCEDENVLENIKSNFVKLNSPAIAKLVDNLFIID